MSVRDMTMPSKHPKDRQGGFTLIELALVMIISGSFMAAAAVAFTNYTIQKRVEHTKESMAVVKTAMSEFRSLTGRYPCPAPLTAAPGDATYGVEDCTPDASFIVEGRDANMDGQTSDDQVFIGAIPVVTIMQTNQDALLPHKNVIDGYGNKFTYVVSARLTVGGSYNDFYGAIYMVDEHDNSLTRPDGSAHMAVISHGENGRGAYTRDGQLFAGCTSGVPTETPPATATDKSDTENCDGDATFMNGLRRTDRFSMNDDFSDFAISKSTAPWKYTGAIVIPTNIPVDPSNPSGPKKVQVINQISNANVGGRVGFGTADPDTELHFSSSIRAHSIRAAEICDAGGTDCMPIETLAGNVADMTCPSGQAVVEISNNKVTCGNIPYSYTESSCLDTQMMYGISNLGKVLCKAK